MSLNILLKKLIKFDEKLNNEEIHISQKKINNIKKILDNKELRNIIKLHIINNKNKFNFDNFYNKILIGGAPGSSSSSQLRLFEDASLSLENIRRERHARMQERDNAFLDRQASESSSTPPTQQNERGSSSGSQSRLFERASSNSGLSSMTQVPQESTRSRLIGRASSSSELSFMPQSRQNERDSSSGSQSRLFERASSSSGLLSMTQVPQESTRPSRLIERPSSSSGLSSMTQARQNERSNTSSRVERIDRDEQEFARRRQERNIPRQPRQAWGSRDDLDPVSSNNQRFSRTASISNNTSSLVERIDRDAQSFSENSYPLRQQRNNMMQQGFVRLDSSNQNSQFDMYNLSARVDAMTDALRNARLQLEGNNIRNIPLDRINISTASSSNADNFQPSRDTMQNSQSMQHQNDLTNPVETISNILNIIEQDFNAVVLRRAEAHTHRLRIDILKRLVLDLENIKNIIERINHNSLDPLLNRLLDRTNDMLREVLREIFYIITTINNNQFSSHWHQTFNELTTPENQQQSQEVSPDPAWVAVPQLPPDDPHICILCAYVIRHDIVTPLEQWKGNCCHGRLFHKNCIMNICMNENPERQKCPLCREKWDCSSIIRLALDEANYEKDKALTQEIESRNSTNNNEEQLVPNQSIPEGENGILNQPNNAEPPNQLVHPLIKNLLILNAALRRMDQNNIESNKTNIENFEKSLNEISNQPLDNYNLELLTTLQRSLNEYKISIESNRGTGSSSSNKKYYKYLKKKYM